MLAHSHHLRDDGALSPVDTEHFRQLPQVLSGSLSDREDSVSEPAHAKIAQLLVKELDSKLAGKEGDVFNDSKANTPLLILGQLNNGGKERLGEKLDTNDYNGLE